MAKKKTAAQRYAEMQYLGDDRRPTEYWVRKFAEDAYASIRRNFRLQRIWPEAEVYAGYKEVNKKREKQGGKYVSTGAAWNDMRMFQIKDASKGNAELEFAIRYYMMFVDIGVGQFGTNKVKAASVDRNELYSHSTRYISEWNHEQGSTHRPFLLPELNHLAKRLEGYYRYTLNEDVFFALTNVFDGQTEINL